MSSPFTAGPRLVRPPRGDAARQAIACMRGYAYQLYASALAWLDLRNGQELYLEVAEDYATVAEDALQSVQVKDTEKSGSVTINSEGVRQTLDAFADLVERNPDREINLRFLSTSPIGRERRSADRIEGDGALRYWRRAATSAEVGPLRTVLLRTNPSDRVRTYIDRRDDEALRRDLLRRVHWDCGRPGLDALRAELEVRLGSFGAMRLGIPAAESAQLSAAVLQRVLDTIVRPGPRRLTEHDLVVLLDSATRVWLPRRDLDGLVGSLTDRIGSGQGVSEPPISHGRPRALEPESDLPLPPILTPREQLVRDLLRRLQANGLAFVIGGTGLGKTVLARLAARASGGNWFIVDLRNALAGEASERLTLALSELGAFDLKGVILDDLNEIEAPHVRRALIHLHAALRRVDAMCLITTYRQPSVRARSELDVGEHAQLAVPYLSAEETGELVSAAGGEARWGPLVHLAGSAGHPQLVQAAIAGLRSRSWPEAERRRLTALDLPTIDIEEERTATRQLLAAVPEEAKSLLFRLSLLLGRFERSLALAVGEVEPSLSQPGERLDILIGPWIDRVGRDQLRVSPLISSAGKEVLAPSEQTLVHRAVAEAIANQHEMDASKADVIFFHALAGKAEGPLLKLAYSIVRARPDVRRMVMEWAPAIRFQRTDRPIYPDNPAISLPLRLSQFLLVAEARDKESIREIWNVLLNELAQEQHIEQRERFEGLILIQLLTNRSAAGVVPNWLKLIFRLEEIIRAKPEYQEWLTEIEEGLAKDEGPQVLSGLFMNQMLGVDSVADLSIVFEHIDELTPESRHRILAGASGMPKEFATIVNGAWLAEHERDSIDWLVCAEHYLRMAAQAQGWGYRILALRCHVARGIMLDEYGDDPAALQANEEAVKLLGPDPVLSRARAKILYRRKDHAGALPLLRSVAGETDLDDAAERAFMHREAGISAAELERWGEARQWFGTARVAAASAASPKMRVMAVGLRADASVAAFKDGDAEATLRTIAETLEELGAIDPESSTNAAYCHRVVRHAVLWLYGQFTEQKIEVGGVPPAMVPGACSNPEPLESIKELPLGHSDIAWYLLADAELVTDVTAGIAAGLRRRLGGRSIPAMELGLRRAGVTRAIRRLDPDALVAALAPWVDAHVHLQNQSARLELDPVQPAYGEIPAIAGEQLESPKALFAAEDALLAFGMVAAISGQPKALEFLHDRFVQTWGINYPGRTVARIMSNGETTAGGSLREHVALAVCRASQQPPLDPDGLFVTGLRFVQATAGSNFRALLEPAITDWTRAAWDRVAREQRFLLRNPAATVGEISRATTSPQDGLRSVADVLLAAADAVRTRIDPEFRTFLRSLR